MNSKGYFLVAAFASFVLSVSLWFLGNADIAKEQGIFVGLWVPSILTLGTYFCPACERQECYGRLCVIYMWTCGYAHRRDGRTHIPSLLGLCKIQEENDDGERKKNN